jgi:hypothetical protein
MAVTIKVNNSSSSADEATCQKVEAAVQKVKGMTTPEGARDLICALCQTGGTNNAQGNLSVTSTDNSVTPPVDTTLTLKELKDIIKSNGIKITVRQYARTRAQECHDIGEANAIPGDLYKKLCHMFGPISTQDSYWCSSFQMDTSCCPSNVKDLLVQHYNSIFKKP